LPVRLEQSLHSDGRESYLRAQVWFQDDAYHARLTGSQDSGVLSSMILANALLVLPAGVMKVEAGEVLTAWLLAPLDGAADLN
jgi:molybdopterin molybdotransferase